MVVRKNRAQVRQPRRLRSWDESFAALVSYRNRYGDCRVPGRWPWSKLGMKEDEFIESRMISRRFREAQKEIAQVTTVDPSAL